MVPLPEVRSYYISVLEICTYAKLHMQNFYLPLVGRWEGGGWGRRGLDTTNLRFHMTRVSERSLKAFVVSSFPHSCFLNILKVAFFTFRLSLSKDWTKKKLVMRKISLFIWKETIHNFIKSETMRRVLFEPSRASYYIEYLCVSLHLYVGEIYIFFYTKV